MKINEIISVKDYLAYQPDCDLDNNTIQSIINETSYFLDSICNGLIWDVWEYNKTGTPDPKNPLYRTERELDYLTQSFLTQVKYTIDLGTWKIGQDTYSQGNISYTSLTPSNRKILSPECEFLLTKARVYKIQKIFKENDIEESSEIPYPYSQKYVPWSSAYQTFLPWAYTMGLIGQVLTVGSDYRIISRNVDDLTSNKANVNLDNIVGIPELITSTNVAMFYDINDGKVKQAVVEGGGGGIDKLNRNLDNVGVVASINTATNIITKDGNFLKTNTTIPTTVEENKQGLVTLGAQVNTNITAISNLNTGKANLSGGNNFTGIQKITGSHELITLKKEAANSPTYIRYEDNLGTRRGVVGFGSGSNNNLNILNEASNSNIELSVNGTGFHKFAKNGNSTDYMKITFDLFGYVKGSNTANFIYNTSSGIRIDYSTDITYENLHNNGVVRKKNLEATKEEIATQIATFEEEVVGLLVDYANKELTNISPLTDSGTDITKALYQDPTDGIIKIGNVSGGGTGDYANKTLSNLGVISDLEPGVSVAKIMVVDGTSAKQDSSIPLQVENNKNNIDTISTTLLSKAGLSTDNTFSGINTFTANRINIGSANTGIEYDSTTRTFKGFRSAATTNWDVANPTLDTHATNKLYVDNNLANKANLNTDNDFIGNQNVTGNLTVNGNIVTTGNQVINGNLSLFNIETADGGNILLYTNADKTNKYLVNKYGDKPRQQWIINSLTKANIQLNEDNTALTIDTQFEGIEPAYPKSFTTKNYVDTNLATKASSTLDNIGALGSVTTTPTQVLVKDGNTVKLADLPTYATESYVDNRTMFRIVYKLEKPVSTSSYFFSSNAENTTNTVNFKTMLSNDTLYNDWVANPQKYTCLLKFVGNSSSGFVNFNLDVPLSNTHNSSSMTWGTFLSGNGVLNVINGTAAVRVTNNPVVIYVNTDGSMRVYCYYNNAYVTTLGCVGVYIFQKG